MELDLLTTEKTKQRILDNLKFRTALHHQKRILLDSVELYFMAITYNIPGTPYSLSSSYPSTFKSVAEIDNAIYILDEEYDNLEERLSATLSGSGLMEFYRASEFSEAYSKYENAEQNVGDGWDDYHGEGRYAQNGGGW